MFRFQRPTICKKYLNSYSLCKVETKPEVLNNVFTVDKKSFGVKKVVQRRKYMLKLVKPTQDSFNKERYVKFVEGETKKEKVNINNVDMENPEQVHQLEDYLLNYKYNKKEVEKNAPLPLSLLASSFIRRALYSNREQALNDIKKINWKKYCCNVKGVRWHASGAWRVLFCKRNYQHNFFVKCDCYFRVSAYGFEKSKELAVRYRKRLEFEYLLLMKRWKEIEIENARRRKIKAETQVTDKEDDEEYEDTVTIVE